MRDRGPPVVFRLVKGALAADKHYYIYVDNVGILGISHDDVAHSLASLTEVFESRGLILHAGGIHSESVRALGVDVKGGEKHTKIELERLWEIRSAIKYVVGVGSVYGRVLEVLIGHCTFAGLVNRAVLSIFHFVYRFLEANYDVRARLWDSVSKELCAFSGAIFLLVQDWDRQWNRLVSTSDSSLEGYGVCHAWWEAECVGKVGRVSDRERFRRGWWP